MMHEFEATQAELQNQSQDDLQRELASLGITNEKPFDLTDPASITTNRHGELTSTQINMFKNARIRSKWWSLLSIIVSIFWLLWLTFVFFNNHTYVTTYILPAMLNILLPILFIWLFLPGTLTYIRKLRLKPLLTRGEIEQITGEIVKVGRGVMVRSEGRHLKMVDKAYPLPLEGHYLFFVLAGTNYLLSAQSLDGSEPGVLDLQTSEKLLVRLSQANNFSLDELTLNREGCLSEHQSERLLLASAKAGIGGLLSIIGLILGIYLFIVWNLAQFAWAWIVASFAGLVFIVVALAASLTCIQSAQDRHDGRVVSQNGPLKRVASVSNGDNSSSASYSYDGEFSYKVSKEAYQALIPGLRYRVYHTPRQHRLMSLEPLDDTPSQKQERDNPGNG